MLCELQTLKYTMINFLLKLVAANVNKDILHLLIYCHILVNTIKYYIFLVNNTKLRIRDI